MNLRKTYVPDDYEEDIYNLWEKSEAFMPKGKGKPYTMVMPPPNANASLHIGHSLNYANMDIIARYQRAIGKNVLLLPGADHAGFETQVVYEKHLAKQGKSRFDFNREELYSQIWDFVQENKGTFESQLRTFGISCDWSRFTFTLDDKVIDTAYSTFKKLWDDGLIYRGERLVNYCTKHQTGFADIEVDYKEKSTPLYYMKYGPFTLATTRPETKFGDTAVAVHPDDKRYQKYIGKEITVDGLNGEFKLKVIADEYVDQDFGTGAVKITPAHDFNDWDIGQRHNLPAVSVINLDGTMNEKAGKYKGLTVLEARESVVEDLKGKDLIEKIDENYQNRVGVCYKCSTVIEPMLLDQWFVDMKKLSEPAIKALQDKKIEFFPAAKREQTISYLEGVRDWNISRQIAWGIPIPAFQNIDDPEEWIFDENVNKETIEVDGKTYKRDPDVFDTWFSSGQWPFVTLDYPKGDLYKKHYPNTLMETGTDILYQWGARMIGLGLYVTGKVPFDQIYLHGMVRSEDGRKMSKSLGNVVDPHGVIQEFGSDAVRMGMISGRSAGDSSAYDPSKIVAGRNFCNKLWNIARFIEDIVKENPGKSEAKPVTSADHWVMSKLQHTIDSVSSHLDEYRISEAYDSMYHFVRDDFADWYIEVAKYELNPGLLQYCLESVLKLAHPFAPFVTETIWQTLELSKDTLLILQDWPKTGKFDSKLIAEFQEIKAIVEETRGIVSSMQLKESTLYYKDATFLDDHKKLITNLAKLNGVHKVEDGTGLHLTSTQYSCWLDIDRSRLNSYADKLKGNQKVAKKRAESLEKRLANKSYTKQAPKKLVEDTEQQLSETKQLIDNIDRELARINS